MEFELLWVPANSLVGGARKVLAPSIKAAEQKGISSEYFMENGNLSVRIEPYRVRQLIVNIRGNAIKYTIKGKIQRRVELMERAWIRVSVSDTGRGIKPEERDLTFEPFRQLRNKEGTRMAQGTGLGLYFCQLMVRAMGSRIWCESEYGFGTIFYFEIPVNCEFRAAIPAVPAARTQASAEGDAGGGSEKLAATPLAGPEVAELRLPFKFLGVDDFYPCRAPLVSFRSKKCGATKVMEAANGEEAIRLVELELKEPGGGYVLLAATS